MTRPLVIGAGCPFMGDDAVGRHVARAVAASGLPDLDIVEADGEATALLSHFSGRDRLVIVDAAASGGRPGTIHRFDASAAPLPALLATPSSHGFGVAAAIELARALGHLPPRVIVIAVEVAEAGPGESLSPAVAAAIAAAADAAIAAACAP